MVSCHPDLSKSTKLPKYALHKASGQARVTLGDRDHYLGKHGSPESLELYDRLVAEWLAAGRNAAVPFDAEPDDVISVLQHANIELLELRVLDQEHDAILDHADETLAALTKTRLWPTFASSGMLSRFASAQTDAAVTFEGVNNAIELLGNQYLARLYWLAANRLDLPA